MSTADRRLKILRTLMLRGPNLWSRRSVFEVWMELDPSFDRPSDELRGLTERLMATMPSLIEHRCGVGERGGFLRRLREGTYPPHILEHLTIEFECLVGAEVGFGKARETRRAGTYKVAVRYRDEVVVRRAFELACDLLFAAVDDTPFDIEASLKELSGLADDVGLGPSTRAIVVEAERRGIPWRRLNVGSFVLLGHASKQRRVWTAETDSTGAIAESIAQDKELTKQLLRAVGVPVPAGRVAVDADDAWEAAREIGVPVVVKPRDGNHGRGVFIGLFTEIEVGKAFRAARAEGSSVIVEKFLAGNEHRLLIVGDRLVAAAAGATASVVGDGTRSVRQLVEDVLNASPMRGPNDTTPLNPVLVDDPAVCLELERQGLSPDSIPPGGLDVLIQRNGNVSVDVTDRVHPSTAAQAVLAARVVGLDIAGIDLLARDISRPLEAQGGGIVEINASPGLHVHLKPSSGSPRPVGEAIVAELFPQGEDGRVPVVCVTGTDGTTSVCRHTRHIMAHAGHTVGLASSEGTRVGERVMATEDSSNLAGAERVLMNPSVTSVVLEASLESILTEGLGFDRCAVAVVTRIGGADPLRSFYIETPEEIFQVARCPVDVVLASGHAVLNADDPLVAGMAPLCAGKVIFFARDASNAVVRAHLAGGGKAVFAIAGGIAFSQGAADPAVVLEPIAADAPSGRPTPSPTMLPSNDGLMLEALLAAVGVALAMGISSDLIRQALGSSPAFVGSNPEP